MDIIPKANLSPTPSYIILSNSNCSYSILSENGSREMGFQSVSGNDKIAKKKRLKKGSLAEARINAPGQIL